MSQGLHGNGYSGQHFYTRLWVPRDIHAESKDDYDLPTGAEDGMVRLFDNVWKEGQDKAKDILGYCRRVRHAPGRFVGAIDMYDKYTFVEVPAEYGKEVLNARRMRRQRLL